MASDYSGHSEKHSPLEQFEIIPFAHTEIGGYDISFTNSSLAMVITVAIITLFFNFKCKYKINHSFPHAINL